MLFPAVGPVFHLLVFAPGRKAGHNMFCKDELLPSDPLFQTLSNLIGMNLCTSTKRVLQTFDWRHIIKRDCTLVRQPKGMTVDAGQIVNPYFLGECLRGGGGDFVVEDPRTSDRLVGVLADREWVLGCIGPLLRVVFEEMGHQLRLL
ncbi:hypothetical protein B0H14DRAFT_2564438 [Mycena olivaceomarginata]|nr:hypothetical protein B0H14DRAFT_2564438 [Mycena olivaceomarginata]